VTNEGESWLFQSIQLPQWVVLVVRFGLAVLEPYLRAHSG